MGVPGWLLRIVVGFLKERELIVRFNGGHSGRKQLPAGGPQGTVLGLFIFLILINCAGFMNVDKDIGSQITTTLKQRKPMEKMHAKFVDDLTLAKSINLKHNLLKKPESELTRPLNYHDRTSHVFAPNIPTLNAELKELVEYSKENGMVINETKSKIMFFNSSRSLDATPKLSLSDDDSYLEVVEQMKLLGVIIQSNLKWSENTEYICKKGYTRLWMLRRLKIIGANPNEMLEVYKKQIRSVMELAVPVWQPGITDGEKYQIERVQRTALYIILGKNYINYDNALNLLDLESLDTRRKTICRNFAVKALKHEKFSKWFTYSEAKTISTRSKKSLLKPVYTRTNKYEDSPIPYLTRTLNNIY